MNNVTININAGTAKYNRQLDQAKAKMRETFGHGSVSSIQATSATLRVLEGNMTNNIRAVERFLAQTLKLGPALQAAFPVIGAVAFADYLIGVGKRVYDFFLTIREEPEKALGGFNKLSTSLASVDDQLKVSNAQLENEIAKLSGKPGDGLKVALLEASAAADKLKESLGNDLEALYKLIGEQRGGVLTQFVDFFTGRGNLKDFQRQVGGLTGAGAANADLQKTMDEGLSKISKAKDIHASQLAQQELLNAITQKYNNLLDAANKKKEEFIKLSKGFTEPAQLVGNAYTLARGHAPVDEQANLENINKDIALLQKQKEIAQDQITNAKLTQKKTGLEEDKANRQLERPVEKMMAELDAQLAAVRAKLSAIGGDPAMEVVAAGAAEAFKKIAVLNEELKKKNKHMTAGTYMDVLTRSVLIAQVEAEEKWKKKLEDTNGALDERISRQKQLNALNAANYAAKRDIDVETQVKGKFGGDYDDPAKAAEIETVRGKIRQEMDLEHERQLRLEHAELAAQIELYTRLSQVAGDYSKTHQAHLDAEIAKLRAEGKEEQILQRIQLDAAKEQAESDTRTAANKLTILNIQRSMAAAFGGVDARQQAEIQNKLAEAEAAGVKGGDLRVLQAKLEAEYRAKIVDEAGNIATADSQRATILDKQIAAIKAQIALSGSNLEMQHALKELEDQRLDVAIKMQLEQDTAVAGVKAFFLEMEKQAEKTSKMIYDSLNEVLNKTSDNLSKIMTGQVGKGGIGKMWGETFKSLGGDLTRNAVHSGLQRGLGALGHHIPGLDKVLVGKPDGTASNPLHVIVDGKGAAGNAVPNPLGGILNRKGGIFGGGDLGGGVFSLLDDAAGGGGDAGERAASGANYYSYTINAPGAQIGSEGRIAQAIEAVHNAAVRNSVLVQQQKAVRMPQIAGGGGGGSF